LPLVAALNRQAIAAALNYEVHACTDITGFGIMGHTLELAKASGVQIDISYDTLPVYPNVFEMYRKGETTGSNKANKSLAQGFWESKKTMSDDETELLFDPQTSGGLLLAVPALQAEELMSDLAGAGVQTAACVGRVVANNRPFVRVV